MWDSLSVHPTWACFFHKSRFFRWALLKWSQAFCLLALMNTCSIIVTKVWGREENIIGTCDDKIYLTQLKFNSWLSTMGQGRTLVEPCMGFDLDSDIMVKPNLGFISYAHLTQLINVRLTGQIINHCGPMIYPCGTLHGLWLWLRIRHHNNNTILLIPCLYSFYYHYCWVGRLKFWDRNWIQVLV